MVRAALGLRARAPEVGYPMDKITSQITAQSRATGPARQSAQFLVSLAE